MSFWRGITVCWNLNWTCVSFVYFSGVGVGVENLPLSVSNTMSAMDVSPRPRYLSRRPWPCQPRLRALRHPVQRLMLSSWHPSRQIHRGLRHPWKTHAGVTEDVRKCINNCIIVDMWWFEKQNMPSICIFLLTRNKHLVSICFKTMMLVHMLNAQLHWRQNQKLWPNLKNGYSSQNSRVY